MIRMLPLPAILIALFAVSSAQAEFRKWRVEHFLQPSATGGAGRLCYVVSDGRAAQLVDQAIQGFTWEWGTVYQITVNVEQARAADGTVAATYKLISVDSQARVPAGTRFQMYLTDRSFIQGQTVLGVKAFHCANATVEGELQRRLDNLAGNAVAPGIPVTPPAGPNAKPRELPEETRRVLLEFSHPKTASEALILESITSASDLGLE